MLQKKHIYSCFILTLKTYLMIIVLKLFIKYFIKTNFKHSFC